MNCSEMKHSLKEYNWDGDFALFQQLLQELECDLSLALEIFYLEDGFSCLWDE